MGDTDPVVGARVTPRADEALRHFFEEQQRLSTGRRAERLQRAEADLRGFLEELIPPLLTDQERALLALERQFDADGAAARTAGAVAVLLLLPLFLDEPRWHGRDLEDRRLRIRLAAALTDDIVEAPAMRGVDTGRAAWIVDAAVRHEIWMLRQEREASRER